MYMGGAPNAQKGFVMIVVSIQYMKGTSKKTGKPYECHKISGIERDYFNGGYRTRDYMVSPAEFARNPIDPGANIEVFQSGEIMVKDTHAFDLSVFDSVL